MPNCNEFLQSIKKAAVEAVEASKPVSICFGKVMSVNPFQVNVEQKLTLGKAQLIFTRGVSNYKIPVVNMETKEVIEVLVQQQLKVGDEVLLLRQQGGNKYVVLDRLVLYDS